MNDKDKQKGIEAIRQGLVEFENYINTRNMDQLMTLYFDDVIYMQHGFETVEGSDNLKRHFTAMFGNSLSTSLAIQEIDVSGDMGYAYIITTSLKQDPNGGTRKVVLRVLETWRLHPDGSWKLTRIAVNNPPTTDAN